MVAHLQHKRPKTGPRARMCRYDDENGSSKGSGHRAQPSASCRCMQPPTTPSPFSVTSSQLIHTASSEPSLYHPISPASALQYHLYACTPVANASQPIGLT